MESGNSKPGKRQRLSLRLFNCFLVQPKSGGLMASIPVTNTLTKFIENFVIQNWWRRFRLFYTEEHRPKFWQQLMALTRFKNSYFQLNGFKIKGYAAFLRLTFMTDLPFPPRCRLTPLCTLSMNQLIIRIDYKLAWRCQKIRTAIFIVNLCLHRSLPCNSKRLAPAIG